MQREFYLNDLDKRIYSKLNKSRKVNKFFGIEYVGKCLEMISNAYQACQGLMFTKDLWEGWYDAEWGFEKLRTVSEWLHEIHPEIDLDDIKRYVFFRVIAQTWNGFLNEELIIDEMREIFTGVDIRRTAYHIDHEYCIDAEFVIKDQILLGVQVKPISYKYMSTPYQLKAKENHRVKNELYRKMYAPYIYVYYKDNTITDRIQTFNKINTILLMQSDRKK